MLYTIHSGRTVADFASHAEDKMFCLKSAGALFIFFPLPIWHVQLVLGWGERTGRGPGVALLVHTTQRGSFGGAETTEKYNSDGRRHSQQAARGTHCVIMSRTRLIA